MRQLYYVHYGARDPYVHWETSLTKERVLSWVAYRHQHIDAPPDLLYLVDMGQQPYLDLAIADWCVHCPQAKAKHRMLFAAMRRPQCVPTRRLTLMLKSFRPADVPPVCQVSVHRTASSCANDYTNVTLPTLTTEYPRR